MPAFSAAATGSDTAADEDALSMIWITPQLSDYNGSWSTGDNPRFATARDGKIYTVDQKNTYIAEVTDQGIKDLYKLSDTPDKNLYGTPISIDEKGNFLLGTNFTKSESLTNFAVYVTATGEIKNFTVPAPQATKLGRLDCLGRVIGDLTKEAYFFIAPDQNPGSTDDNTARIIKVTGDGTAPTAMAEVKAVEVAESNTRQGIAQPAFASLAEAQAADAVNDFYYSSCGAKSYYASYVGGVLTSNFSKDMLYTTVAANNGFDTFVVGGKRYFVRNYATKAGQSPMSFVVMDENGDAVATWTNEDFIQDGGYSTIVAEPLANGTANIYIYNSANTKGGAAAMFNFDPAKAGEPVKPYIPTGDTVDNPYKISTPQDLLDLADKRIFVPFYVSLENDIDMSDLTLQTINVQGNAVHFDGKNHVIKNLTISEKGGSCAMFDYFIGSIKDLGLENVNSIISASSWGVNGTLVAYVGMKQGGEALIENCFVTGVAGTGDYYAGGLVGGVNDKSSLTVRNCYAIVDVTATTGGGMVGGLVGPANAETTLVVENCYAAGSVTGLGGGVVFGTATETAKITLNNVVAWNTVFANASSGAITAKGNATITNAYAWDGISGITVTDSKTTAELQAIVTAWEGFNEKLNDGYPVLAWQDANGLSEIIIYGTKENPHKISTPEDLASWGEKMTIGNIYFSIENDIDMEGIEYSVPLQGTDFVGHHVFIEGNNHIIRNLNASADTGGGYAGLIGIFMGEVRNLGIENISSKGWCAGGIAGMVGNTNYTGTTIVENCFVTGTVEGTGGYAGGLGATSGNLVVKNAYTNVEVTGNNSAFGNSGFITSYFFAPKTVTFENIYVGGSVSGKTVAGVFYTATPTMPTLKVNNAIVLSPSINGTTSATAISALGTIENSFVSDGTLVNGAAVEGAKPTNDLIATITSWDAFNKKIKDGMPVLAWQEADEEVTGIGAIEVDGAEDATPVYYNLQGVQVANPENGVYIVRRGNKVSKELVR